MILHGGYIIIHSRVQERQHNLFFHEGYSVVAVSIDTINVIIDSLGLLVPLNLLGELL